MNHFGAGYLIGRAAATTANPNPTPRKFGQLQEVDVDDSFTTKQVFGSGSRALRDFRGQAKTALKAKFARVNGRAFSELFYQASTTTGGTLTMPAELGTIPSSTAYTITAANASNFVADLGVEYATTGAPLKYIGTTGTPAQGQYTCSSAGVYTFASADAGAVVVLAYRYSATSGYTVSVPNLIQQEAPYFEVHLFNPTDGGMCMDFFKCSANKLTRQFKQGDIMIPDFEMAVFDPGTGIPWTEYYATE